MSSRERNDLIVSWLTLSFAFSLIISDNFLNLMKLAEAIPIALVGVGTGFVFHEIAHRNVARGFGFEAEFRSWNQGLILAVALAVLSGGSFTFAAPGATYILANRISREQNGKISIAGPVTNILIGFALVLGAIFINAWFVSKVLFNAGLINFFLAFFNLLPLGPLDGTKVLNWNPAYWAITIAIAGLMSFFPGLVIAPLRILASAL